MKMEKKFYIRLVLVAMLLFTQLVHSQELFLPDTSRWELFINEEFISHAINLVHYKDNNRAKIEGGVELPALLMDSNVYIQNGNLVIKTVHLSNPIPCPEGTQCQFGGRHNYTSGAIVFTDNYDYGSTKSTPNSPTAMAMLLLSGFGAKALLGTTR